MLSKKKNKKIFIIAGEISGDNIAYSILRDIKKKNNIEVHGIGGEALNKIGVKSIFSIQRIAVMGLIEILPKIPSLILLIRKTVNDIKRYKPDLLITVDSPDFCFRVLKKIKKMNPKQKVLHIVAPSVWAWKSSRAKKISEFIDHLFVLYPFESKYFILYKINTKFIGHPLFTKKLNKKPLCSNNIKKKIISIYPGSREKEIKNHLAKILNFLNKIDNLDNYDFNIIAVDHLMSLIKKICKSESYITNLKILRASKYKRESFQTSYLAIAVSGTIVLELAMHLVPVICVYKLNIISYHILRRIVKTKYISLVNIILNKRLVPELIQDDFSFTLFQKEFISLIQNKDTYNKQKKQFLLLRRKILYRPHVVLNEIRKII